MWRPKKVAAARRYISVMSRKRPAGAKAMVGQNGFGGAYRSSKGPRTPLRAQKKEKIIRS